MFAKLGGRKLVFTLLAISVGVAVDLFTERGLSQNLKELLIFVGGIYTIGNVGVNAAHAIKEKSTRSDKVLDALQQEMLRLNQSQEVVFNNLNTNTQATGEILRRVGGPAKGTQNGQQGTNL